MHSDEESFFCEIQPGASGITLSHTNNKSSVLCPETQNITSQYLVLQQLDAHQKMVSRAKGVVDTSAPKSMHSYRSVSSQQKRKMMKQLKNNPHDNFPSNVSDDFNGASSSRLGAYYSEEDESADVPLHNKAIQTGIPVSNFTCKTAEKISWYLEALSLGELQSDYFTFHDHNCNHAKQLQIQQGSGKQGKKKIIKGDIMEWHREHFMEPKKPFSPRLLDNPSAKSKVRDMRCYNPPFRRKKIKSSQSSDTFESYDEDENEESSQVNANHKSSDLSSGEEETLVNKRITDDAASHYSHHSSIPLVPPYRRDYSSYTDPSFLNRTEEEKYLDFLSKVTEDILRSGVFSDKAIRQAFEFHMKFYKDDPNKEKLQSLLDQVLEGLKVTNDDEENFQPRNSFLFSLSRPNSPPEKEISRNLSASDLNQTTSDLNAAVDESVNDKESDNS